MNKSVPALLSILRSQRDTSIQNKQKGGNVRHQIDKQKIHRQAIQHHKKPWRDSGPLDKEFSRLPALRAKMLDPWQIGRINLTQRSYKSPQGFKGIHVPTCKGDLFKSVGLNGLPQSFKEHAQLQLHRHQDYVLRPSRYSKLKWQTRLEQLHESKRQSFKLINTKRSQNFGFSETSTRQYQISLRR